nr:MAG TPA: hypothetical protein [Caudoviricetes sp.]
MSKFKVTNPDEPIEIDLYQDIPSKDPDTGIDQVDGEGNILVKRYVTRSINSKGIANIKNALPQINTNKEAIAALDKYAKDNVASITSDLGSINDNLLGTQTDLSDLTQTVSVLKGKINGIQGIDIDVVQADVDALKKSAYLITGGVLKGDVSIQTPNTAVLTLTPSGSSSYASFSTNNDVLDCTTTWGKVFKVSEEGKYFYGLADKATQDALGQDIADNYIKDITGANATLTITKGAGTTSILSINNVLQAQKAIADKNNNDITTTYATKTENTSNLASAKAYADAKKNEAIVSANAYTDQEKAKYLPLKGTAVHATTADKATTATNADYATSAVSATTATNASHATIADRAYPRRVGDVDLNFNWAGKAGQPTWLWGGEDGSNMYVYNPANFSVNYSNSAGSVAWGGVTGRPTKVSQFTNDSGYITNGHNFASGVIVSGYNIKVG